MKDDKIKRMKAMYDRNTTVIDIAKTLGVSTGTITRWLREFYPEREKCRMLKFNVIREKNYKKRKEKI